MHKIDVKRSTKVCSMNSLFPKIKHQYFLLDVTIMLYISFPCIENLIFVLFYTDYYFFFTINGTYSNVIMLLVMDI